MSNQPKVPKIFATGNFYQEDDYLGDGRKRVIRVLNGRRTHTIDLDLSDNLVTIENDATSSERTLTFDSAKQTTEFWNRHFGEVTVRYDWTIHTGAKAMK